MHGKPVLDKSPFDIPFPFKKVHISPNKCSFQASVSSKNLKFGTLGT